MKTTIQTPSGTRIINIPNFTPAPASISGPKVVREPHKVSGLVDTVELGQFIKPRTESANNTTNFKRRSHSVGGRGCLV